MKKVLVIEDEVIIAMLYKKTIESLGFEVIAVCSRGAEAIEMVREKNPDIIISAIFLSTGISGLKTVKLLRYFSKAPVIFITGSNEKEIKDEALKIDNVVAYLNKPLESYALDIALYDAAKRADSLSGARNSISH